MITPPILMLGANILFGEKCTGKHFKIFSLPGESYRFPEWSVHSTSHGLFSHMSRKRAEAVGGQNETSDVESSGGHSGWLLTSLHSAPHEILVLRGEPQVS